MRGGAARGVSSGGAVFRVRRVGDVVLSVLQWLLLLWGVALIVLSLVEHYFQAELPQGLTVFGLESDLYAPPIHLRLAQGIATGVVAMGLSAALFYLRRLYSRSQ